MNPQEQARQLAAKQRQHDRHQQESMLGRAESELESEKGDRQVDASARELGAKQRQQDAQRQESMLSRAESEEIH
ncbi:hypothetical protein [Synechococcus sp. PCC 7336]|uniref:hypothetical protein n=1 Tax=Synechococcus sp. PCC 7336 TaxID=195250 RepID=UPI000348A418|nr:hypothetical protein [Synechococcus sp. PCC 7336]